MNDWTLLRFAEPLWIALILPVLALHFWRGRRAAQPTLMFSSVAGLRGLPKTLAQRIKALLPWIELLALSILTLALARPQAGQETVRVTNHGVALALLIDRSGSMADTDLDENRHDRVQVTRLDVVKEVVADFVDAEGRLPGRPDDLITLISFCSFPQAHCPPTLDHLALLAIAKDLELVKGRTPEDTRALGQTALGDGLLLAVDRLRGLPAKSKVVVLLSDGASNTGAITPDVAAKAAKDAGIRVYCIGIGRQSRGLDVQELKAIAEVTGGATFIARSADDLVEVYEKIDGMERTEMEASVATRWRELWLWPLIVGLSLLLVHRMAVLTRFRSLP